MMDFNLRGKRVVVIGAHRGIGLEIAKGFQDQGARVIITSEQPGIFATKDVLNARTSDHEVPVEAMQFDISDREQVESAFSEIGGLDVLVQNAGLFLSTPSTDGSAENAARFTRQVDVNINGSRHCAVAAATHMGPGSRIIFTASIWGKVGGPGYSGYVASKHGILGLVKVLAMDLGRQGITVNAVNPGSTATEMNLNELTDELQAALSSQMWIRPGLIEPEHMVGSYLFLASDAASEITGQSISVDRGQTIAGAS